jgi:dynein heavy chain 1
LLVENVENVDPLLNPILNKEIQRTGGRTLVRIGTEEVDYSPKFRIILSTKNPAVKLTPDLCSRVTLLNFTVTPDSLQSQSLSYLVKAVKPDLEAQRETLMKLQGEQNVKLRELEDQMLSTISSFEGSILEDDRVVEGMEVLMKEGHQVEEQISKSEQVMQQVHQAVGRFEPFAVTCRKLFVLLESLREISFLYEFTAKMFMAVLEHCLENKSGSPDMDETRRIDLLRKALFGEIAARVSRGLQYNDKIAFGLYLCRLATDDNTMGAQQVDSAELLIEVIVKTFGEEFAWQGRGLNDLAEVTEFELGPTVPLLLCQAPGHDVSGRVEAMARERGKDLQAVAMGSSEGYETAESMIAMGCKQGKWVMLKNVHLCVDWLREVLVKKLQALSPLTSHKDFRIFITSEINPRLPTALMRLSDTIVAEAPSGIRATLSRFLRSIAPKRFDSPIRNRLYLVLGWTHAVLQERLRFVPEGWTEAYEWTEADASHALDAIDALLPNNILNPDGLPWDAIRATLSQGVFGGRIVAARDQQVLDDLISHLFVSESFNVGFELVQGVTLPETTSRQVCLEWIDSLPSYSPPNWLGLDSRAEVERERRRASDIVAKVAVLETKFAREDASVVVE